MVAERNPQESARFGLHSSRLPGMAPTPTNICNFNPYLPDGEELYDYQHVGIGYCLIQTLDGKGSFISDEQGLGKTRQAIVTAKVHHAIQVAQGKTEGDIKVLI